MLLSNFLSNGANGVNPQGQDEILKRLFGVIILVLAGLSFSLGCSSEYQAGPSQSQSGNSDGKKSFGTTVVQVSTGYTNITPDELKDKMDNEEEFILLDVRPRPYYDAGHLPDAVSMPLKELWRKYSQLDPNTEIVLYCQTGITCISAAQMLVKLGFTDVKYMVASIDQWKYGFEINDSGTILTIL